MITELIAVEHVPAVMQLVYPELQRVVTRFAPHRDIDEIVELLMSQQMQLWVATTNEAQMKGWLLTKVICFTDGIRRLHLDLLHGDDIDDLLKHLEDIEEWALKLGVSEVSANVRPGLSKKLRRQAGFSKDYEVVMKHIRRSLH